MKRRAEDRDISETAVKVLDELSEMQVAAGELVGRSFSRLRPGGHGTTTLFAGNKRWSRSTSAVIRIAGELSGPDKAALAAARDGHIIEAARAAYAEAELAVARAKASDDFKSASDKLQLERLGFADLDALDENHQGKLET